MFMSSREVAQDHLFVNYASEDVAFSDWLSLKLASEGYNIWYDRMKLLGGESYPRDIDNAIKNQTFRFITLLSRNSINKANPLKERTLALTIAKERNMDFLIPINVDGLKPHQLPWMASDLTFISFERSWYVGFAALLKKLESIGAPKNGSRGKNRVVQWLSTEESISPSQEKLWTNILPVLGIPQYIRQFVIPPDIDIDSMMNEWSIYVENPALVWSFTNPPSRSFRPITETAALDWRKEERVGGIKATDMVAFLLRRSIEVECLARGLRFTTDGSRLYFPKDLIPSDRLHFTGYHGTRAWIKCVGERKFPVTIGGDRSIETSRYYLSPTFRSIMNLFGSPVVRVGIEIHWTDVAGNELPHAKAARHRRTLCKAWWNYEWLSRFMAIVSWLTREREKLVLGKTESGDLVIGGSPIKLTSPIGIKEDLLKEQKKIAKKLLRDGEDEELQ